MDIAERRLPQDGRIRVRRGGYRSEGFGDSTIYGQKIVTRILDRHAINHDLDQLGFEPSYLKILKEQLTRPHGILMVTGPTGSGKSTTLYSALNYLRDSRLNITTVEDPVEYRLTVSPDSGQARDRADLRGVPEVYSAAGPGHYSHW